MYARIAYNVHAHMKDRSNVIWNLEKLFKTVVHTFARQPNNTLTNKFVLSVVRQLLCLILCNKMGLCCCLILRLKIYNFVKFEAILEAINKITKTDEVGSLSRAHFHTSRPIFSILAYFISTESDSLFHSCKRSILMAPLKKYKILGILRKLDKILIICFLVKSVRISDILIR